MEAFVYVWINMTNKKYYVGYHLGEDNDGYVSSSHSDMFWNDFRNELMMWMRIIIYRGSRDECLFHEQELLKQHDLKSSLIYNNARGSHIVFTDEVIKKISASSKLRWSNMSEDDKKIRNKKISDSKKGVKRPESVSIILSKLYVGKTFVERYGETKAREIGEKISTSNKGKVYHSEEWKSGLSDRMKGNDFGSNQSEDTKEKKRIRFLSEDNPGKNKSFITREKISQAKRGVPSKQKGIKRNVVNCPYCDKRGGIGVMHRWHFENCKFK